MKALSIKQPWAWLICKGFKDIENRDWRIGRNPQHGPYKSQSADFRISLPARIYVHAGKSVDTLGLEDIGMKAELLGLTVPQYAEACMVCESWLQGAIIGEVDITGCVTESPSPWFVGKYGFTLVNPVLYDDPLPCRGRLGFFEPEIA